MGNPKGLTGVKGGGVCRGGKRGQERSSLCSYQPPQLLVAWPSGLLLEGVKFSMNCNNNNKNPPHLPTAPLNNLHHLQQACFLASIGQLRPGTVLLTSDNFRRAPLTNLVKSEPRSGIQSHRPPPRAQHGNTTPNG